MSNRLHFDRGNKISPSELDQFRSRILEWFSEVARDMPWRRSKNPYHIWVSEIMLQQTRVDQATPYFERFIKSFPNLKSLADADQDTVLKNWEGLGYYSRARNLHKAAKRVRDEFDGIIPQDADSFSDLPGVGPYTKAAVLSIAFDEPLAAVDGNIIRVLSRINMIAEPVNRGPVRKAIGALADRLLDREHPGDFNQAMMELGATVCKPKNPACHSCPVSDFCLACSKGRQAHVPTKDKKKKIPHHQIGVGVLSDDQGRYFIAQRPESAMLGGLWEFPGGKKEEGESIQNCCKRELQEELGVSVKVGEEITQIKHAYSHFKITLHAFECQITDGIPKTKNGMPSIWATKEDLAEYAFPKANRKLIEILSGEDD